MGHDPDGAPVAGLLHGLGEPGRHVLGLGFADLWQNPVRQFFSFRGKPGIEDADGHIEELFFGDLGGGLHEIHGLHRSARGGAAADALIPAMSNNRRERFLFVVNTGPPQSRSLDDLDWFFSEAL